MKHPQRMFRTPTEALVHEQQRLERELEEHRHRGNGIRQVHNRLWAIAKALRIKASRAQRGIPVN